MCERVFDMEKKFKLNFLNDYLLLDSTTSKKFITANNILSNKKDLVFLPNNTLNLYTALAKRVDFAHTKLLGALPFCYIDFKYVEEFLPSSYKADSYWKLRKCFSYYFNRKRIGRPELFRLWTGRNILPFSLLRIIADISSENREEERKLFADFTERIEYFDNFQLACNVYLPRKLQELESSKLAYFVGCAAGDGGFCLDDYWMIVDGDKEDIESSVKHINNVKDIISDIFKLKFTDNIPRVRGNKCDLYVANKWFGRFLNFFFGLPYGKKKGVLQKPKLFGCLNNNDKLTKLFWRGCFDTDGSCAKKGKSISFSSATRSFLLECKSDLNKLGIKCRDINEKSPRDLRIKPEYFVKFTQEIGFSHPRKLNIALNSLSNGSYFIDYDGIKNENIFNNYFDFRKIKELRVLGLGCLLKEFRAYNTLKQVELAGLIGCTKSQIETWENNQKTTPFEIICNIWQRSNKDIESIFSFIAKNSDSIKWKTGIRGDANCFVKLPLFVSKDIINIARNIRLYDEEVRILKAGWDYIPTIKNIFDVRIFKDKSKFYMKSYPVIEFFRTFFNYSPVWTLSEQQIKDIRNNLETIH